MLFSHKFLLQYGICRACTTSGIYGPFGSLWIPLDLCPSSFFGVPCLPEDRLHVAALGAASGALDEAGREAEAGAGVVAVGRRGVAHAAQLPRPQGATMADGG